MTLIEVKDIKKYFGKTHALDGVTFDVQEGEIFGFLGPNGAGKTTTIRCLMDFLRPTSGTISIFSYNANRQSKNLKNYIGYLSGDVRLYENWTGKDHILFLEKLRGKNSIAYDLSQKLNLDINIKFRQLSSGNKQKLGLILALMFEPKLIIMDEPTVGLDPLLQNLIYEILLDFQKRGSTIFMSSHNLAEVDKLCHRVGIIKDGKLVAIEGIQALKEKRMHIVKIYFNGPFNRQDFILENVEVQNEFPDNLVLGVKGGINPLMQKLSKYNLRELEISHATLEDIFLEYYGQNNHNNNNQQNQTSEPQNIISPTKSHDASDLNEIPRL